MVLTRIQGPELHVFAAEGDLAAIERRLTAATAWAKEQGCDAAVFTGRRGHERTFLTREGWTPMNVRLFKKEL